MENEFHQWLRTALPHSSRLNVGLGDDAAVIDWTNVNNCVVTSDLLADGVHFDLSQTSPQRIGRKCLAVNLSDIAAMAATPVAAFVSLMLPRSSQSSDPMTLAKELYEGMIPLAAEFDTVLAGGDTNTWDGALAVNVTLIGESGPNGPLTRAGAQVGDAVFVTGELGGSIAGRHLDFEPRVKTALQLHEQFNIHACMDISDGLALDASRLAKESRCGLEFDLAKVPISAAAKQAALDDPGKSALERALSDGEDFELLFTASVDDAHLIESQWQGEIPITRIGTVIEEFGIWQIGEGERVPMHVAGYEHQ